MIHVLGLLFSQELFTEKESCYLSKRAMPLVLPIFESVRYGNKESYHLYMVAAKVLYYGII